MLLSKENCYLFIWPQCR